MRLPIIRPTPQQRQQLFFLGDCPTPPRSFAPPDLPGLALWLDADDASTLTVSSGAVSEWRDKSGNNHTFTTSGASRPTLVSSLYKGRNALRFDGVDDLLICATSIASAQPITIYAVARSTQTSTPGPRSYVYDGRNDNTDRCLLALRATTGGTGVGIWSGAWMQRVEAYSSAWRSFASAYNGASSILEYDGVTTTGNAGTGDLNQGMILGANYLTGVDWLTGEIVELLVYVGAHNEAQRAQVREYLEREVGELLTLDDLGLTAYWDADDIAGANGDPISTWPDGAGSNHATAAGSARPTLVTGDLNGRNSVSFDGVDDRFTIPSIGTSGGEWTCVAVGYRSSTAHKLFTLGSGHVSSFPYGPILYNDGNYYASDSTGIRISSQPSAIGWYLLTAERHSALGDIRLYMNGSTAGGAYVGASGDNVFSYLGGRSHSGSINEYTLGKLTHVSLYVGTTSRLRTQQLEGILAHKLGLTPSLPDTHPFKQFAPRKKV